METVSETLPNGNVIEYQIVNGTAYKLKTDKRVIDILERVRAEKTRIIVDYGDPETGVSWGDRHDICGYIGRSGGDIKIPLLVFNKRSYGGGALLDDRIIGIKTSAGKHILYRK